MQMDYKDKIITELDTLRKKETQDKQPFKARAYAKVISELKEYKGAVREIADIEGIPGIGEKIRAKIQEIISSGQLKAAQEIREERQFNVLDELIAVHGIGPIKARELVTKHKVKSIEDLRDKFEKDPTILNDVQAIGLKHYEDIAERIPRTEMAEHEKLLLKAIREVSPSFESMVVGSYRRKLETSGDIDVILKLPGDMSAKASGELFKGVVEKLKEIGYIIDVLGKGAKKCMAVVRIGNGKARRLDLLLTPENEYSYSLLYFTGSGPFNVIMRQYALDKGYSMSEHGMKILADFEPEPQPVPNLLTEKDIFDFLKIPYIEPSKRTPEEFERVMAAATEGAATAANEQKGRRRAKKTTQ